MNYCVSCVSKCSFGDIIFVQSIENVLRVESWFFLLCQHIDKYWKRKKKLFFQNQFENENAKIFDKKWWRKQLLVFYPFFFFNEFIIIKKKKRKKSNCLSISSLVVWSIGNSGNSLLSFLYSTTTIFVDYIFVWLVASNCLL